MWMLTRGMARTYWVKGIMIISAGPTDKSYWLTLSWIVWGSWRSEELSWGDNAQSSDWGVKAHIKCYQKTHLMSIRMNFYLVSCSFLMLFVFWEFLLTYLLIYVIHTHSLPINRLDATKDKRYLIHNKSINININNNFC